MMMMPLYRYLNNINIIGRDISIDALGGGGEKRTKGKLFSSVVKVVDYNDDALQEPR